MTRSGPAGRFWPILRLEMSSLGCVQTLTCYHPGSFVQLDLPFLRTPPDGGVPEAALRPQALDHPERPVPAPPSAPSLPAVDFVRMRRARRYVLRVRPDGSVRVTVPRGGSRAEAIRFLDKHAAWIQRERLIAEGVRFRGLGFNYEKYRWKSRR